MRRFFQPFRLSRQRRFWPGLGGLSRRALCLSGVLACAALAYGQQEKPPGGAASPPAAPIPLQGQVAGRVLSSQAGQSVAGRQVALMRFVLDNANGQPKGSLLGRTITDAQGAFHFPQVLVQERSVLRVLVHWGDGVVRGPLFTLQANALRVEQTIRLPGQVAAIPRQEGAAQENAARPHPSFGPEIRPESGLGNAPGLGLQNAAGPPRIEESVLVLEPRIGALQATWVLHLFSAQPASLKGEASRPYPACFLGNS